MNSGLFITLSTSIVIYIFAKQSTMKRFNFWGLPGWKFCALRDAIMGLGRKKKPLPKHDQPFLFPSQMDIE
jgi:hypothetical protein